MGCVGAESWTSYVTRLLFLVINRKYSNEYDLLIGTNTYLIGNGKKRILLDTGDGNSAYYPLLKQVLEEQNVEIQVDMDDWF